MVRSEDLRVRFGIIKNRMLVRALGGPVSGLIADVADSPVWSGTSRRASAVLIAWATGTWLALLPIGSEAQSTASRCCRVGARSAGLAEAKRRRRRCET